MIQYRYLLFLFYVIIVNVEKEQREGENGNEEGGGYHNGMYLSGRLGGLWKARLRRG